MVVFFNLIFLFVNFDLHQGTQLRFETSFNICCWHIVSIVPISIEFHFIQDLTGRNLTKKQLILQCFGLFTLTMSHRVIVGFVFLDCHQLSKVLVYASIN